MQVRLDNINADSQNAPPARRPSLATVLVLVAVLNVLSLGVARMLDYGGRDDAYITYRYAKNLAAGHGLVFNIGDRVEGYSAFLWCLQLAAVSRLGGDIATWGVWLGCACHVLCVVGVAWVVARRLSPEHPAAGAMAVGILGACSTPLLYYALSGMETVQHALLVTGGVMGVSLARSWRGLALGVLCAALAGISRPEGPALILVVAAALAFRADLARSRRIRWLIGLLFAASVVIGGQYLWRRSYYGSWFPNTYHAKVGAPDASIIRAGLVYIFEFVLATLALVWLPIWWRLRDPSRRSWTVAVVLVLGLHVGFAWAVGGDFMPMTRFLIPTIPVLIAALVQCCVRVLNRVTPSPGRWLVAAAVCLGICGAGLFHRFEFRALRAKNNIADYRRVSDWLVRQAQPDESMALTAIGVIPYYVPIDTYDFFGLTEEAVAGTEVWAELPAGHRRTDGTYIFTRQPTYILIHPRCRNVPPTEEQFVAEMVGYPGLDQLLVIPEFTYQYRYAVVRVTPPTAANHLYLALYVRRGVDLVDEAEPMNLSAIKTWLRNRTPRR